MATSAKAPRGDDGQAPADYNHPFGYASLAIPPDPPDHFPLPHHRSPLPRPVPPTSSASPATTDDKVPPSYDFPFGIPLLLLDSIPRPTAKTSSAEPIPRPAEPPTWPAQQQAAASQSPSRSDLTKAAVAEAEQEPPALCEGNPYVPTLRLKEGHPHLGNSPGPNRTLHVLSNNIRSSFVAHALGTSPKRLPVRLIVRDSQAWYEEGSQVRVVSEGVLSAAKTLVVEAPSGKKWRQQDYRPIDQLIITAEPTKTVEAIAPYASRIDSRTVICLIQDGLGVVEQLNEVLFKDRLTRPMYVLGHMTHRLRHLQRKRPSQRKNYLFALGEEMGSGTLHLSAYVRAKSADYTEKRNPGSPRGNINVLHFLQLMKQAPRLHSVDLPFANFLARKLPTLVFQSVVDPVCVLLDCTYKELTQNENGMKLVGELLSEICQLIIHIPELASPQSQDFRTYVRSQKLRHDVLGRLRNMTPGLEAEMRQRARLGKDIGINYFTGWFVRRGQDIGVEIPLARRVVRLVKGKSDVTKRQLDDINIQIKKELGHR